MTHPADNTPLDADKDSNSMNMSDLVVSLVNESALLADVLHCSLQLLELFDPDEIVDLVVISFRKSCQGELRVWTIKDMMPVQMGQESVKPENPQDMDLIMDRVMQVMDNEKFRQTIDQYDFFHEGNHVMEVVSVPTSKYDAAYIASLYFKHMLRALNNLKDRLVIVKTFQAIREIMDLKGKLENSLHDIRHHSNNSIVVISDLLQEVIDISGDIRNNVKRAGQIQDIAYAAMNETQIGDLTNQKIFASLHNLELLFIRLKDSLDSTSRKYLESLYQPTNIANSSENVVSESLIQGPEQQSNQNAVDDLLAELGL
ncbi:MAG: hypothetical protein HQM12_00470 [SAR324 cluster bacterium]|nr:hypothetical protein [SAR324 cluster bacterium]